MRIRGQRLTIILVPQGGARTYSFQARVDLLVVAGSLLGLAILITVTLMFTYGRYFHASRRTAALQGEVDRLKRDLRQMDDLRQELAENERTRAKVLGLLATGVPDSLGRSAPITIASVPGGLTGGMQSNVPGGLTEDQSDLRAREIDFARSVPRSWPVRGPVTKEFLSASRDGRGFHPGMDIAAATGVAVRAAAAGTVTYSGWDPEYGYLIVIDHGMGLETRYGHNSRLSVSEGERVERGQLISAVGSTGRSTAPHLHFEIRKDGIAVDPRIYLE